MSKLRAFFGATRVKVIAGSFALLLIGGVLGAVIAMAAPTFAAGHKANGPLTTTPSGKAKYCQVYEQSLENQLHVTQQQLEAANQQALKDAITAAVQDGKLTQAQADQIEQMIAANGTNVCDHLSQFLSQHRGAHGGPEQAVFQQVRDAVRGAVAAKLHITTTDLQTALQGGTDIVTLAKQHNVTQNDLNATIQATVKAQLDSLVQAKTITTDQESMALNFLTAQLNAGHYGLVGLGPKLMHP